MNLHPMIESSPDPRPRFSVTLAGLLALIFCLPSLPGCFTGSCSVGSPLAFTDNSKKLLTELMEVGRTTQSDILEMFGSPTEIRTTHEGDVFRYLYREITQDTVDIGLSALFGLVSVSLFRSESDRKATENLTVFFSEQGKLLDWSYSPLSR